MQWIGRLAKVAQVLEFGGYLGENLEVEVYFGGDFWVVE